MNFKISLIYITLLIIAKCTKASRSSKSGGLLSPINIDTSRVTRSFHPLKISIDVPRIIFSSGMAINTGKEIRFPLTKKQEMGSQQITLDNITYTLADRYLLINQDGSHKNRSGHAINGKGYPIEGVNIFANIDQYGSLKEAKKHPNGLLVLSLPVDVIDIPNPTFIQFGILLRSGKLKAPNSTAKFSTLLAFSLFDSLIKNRAYYTYTGSLYDPETKTQITEVPQIVPKPPYGSISYEQFAAFEYVLDTDSNPLNTIAPLNPVKGREIEAVKGLYVELRPFDVTIFLP
ncbi:carbonic anhydrase 7-like [Planococcus citri]|uniref:carbonic anhydrase 7-like n=1 Tax=Planococcus citri TaxID=170843 RepID=UPI0031F9990D